MKDIYIFPRPKYYSGMTNNGDANIFGLDPTKTTKKYYPAIDL